MKTLATLGIVILGATGVGAVDANKLTEVPLQKDVVVAGEQVKVRQVDSVVETEMPWKGEAGLKIKYDMGEPTAEEKLKDKRNKQVTTETVGDDGFKIDILLDKKPKTNTFCYTIDGYENYDFFYQPALTQEEIDEGAERPEEIVGSYAVYHKTLENNNYKTGKVMHIPFPYVWEVDNKDTTKQRAENLTYSDGQLCVVVQQDFLDKAKYPVRIDPTFGYTSIGASSQNNNVDEDAFGSSDTAVTGTLTKVSAALRKEDSDASGSVYYFFSSSASDRNSLYNSGSESESMTTTFAWYDSDTTSTSLSGTTHYVTLGMVDTGPCLFANCNQLAYDTGSGTNGGKYNLDTWFANDTINYSVYATYTESAEEATAEQSIPVKIDNGSIKIDNGNLIIK